MMPPEPIAVLGYSMELPQVRRGHEHHDHVWVQSRTRT